MYFNARIVNTFSSREYITKTCQTHQQLHKQQNQACQTVLKDGNKVEPLPQQASVTLLLRKSTTHATLSEEDSLQVL
jgi:hypothetical protein